MPRYRITLTYDGTDFEGWQVQRTRIHSPSGSVVHGHGASARSRAEPRTVQGVVESALARLAAGAAVPAVGAGRTDAGVHALGQVATFELAREMAPDALVRALNGLLPPDARVLAAAEVAAGFDARRSATSKLYRYALDVGPIRLPLRRRVAGHHRGPLDPVAVAAAAALYVGRHDFAALASSGGSVTTTVRTVHRSEVRFEPEPATGDARGRMIYEVAAEGFLRKMVRSMMGGLIAAGSGAMTLPELQSALESGDRGRWPAPAEACGLTLVRVEYS
jgi:tRNA pseudouridine38-40 synthase